MRDKNDIREEVVSFFHSNFTADLEIDQSDNLLNVIPPILTTEDNLSLTVVPTIEEVHETILSMNV